MVNKLQY
jgi:hypothetical protein